MTNIKATMELSSNLNEEDNCIFILQHSEFDEWLDKNGVQYIITHGSPNENMINNHVDPLLNQLNSNETFDTLSDTETKLEETGTHKTIQKPLEKTSKLLTKQSVDEHNLLNNKCDILEEVVKKGLSVNFIVLKTKTKLVLTDCDDKLVELSSALHIAFTAAREVNIPKGKRSVQYAERITLASDLNVYMACLCLNGGSKLFICPVVDCDKVFTTLKFGKLHALVHIGHKSFKCDYSGCTWAFYSSFKLRRHQECHKNVKDFICTLPYCGRRFTNIYNLNIHVKKHSRPSHLSCSVQNCTEKFQTSRLRDKHYKTDHNISEAPYRCSQPNCTKVFFKETTLKLHRRHGHKGSDLQCTYANCGKTFQVPCRLKEHQRQHTGQRPYRCKFEACDWTFTTASKLKRHENTHIKDKKFHCTIGECNKSFSRSEHLKEHTLTHVGQKCSICEACSEIFFGKSALVMHMRKAHPKQQGACARSQPFAATQITSSSIANDGGDIIVSSSTSQHQPSLPTATDKSPLSAEALLEQAIQSLGVGTGLLPDTEPLGLLENENFSTVNLRDLD